MTPLSQAAVGRGGEDHRSGDAAPSDHGPEGTGVTAAIRSYLVGLALAAVLTAGSFWLSSTHVIYGPAVNVALIVLAIAQVGIHLIFFLHLTTAPDHINNTLALAFGILVVVLLIGGTLWIMGHMNANMMPGGGMMHTAPMTPGSGMKH